MPKLVNKNAHGVRANGARLMAGQVRDVDGEEADALKGIPGVETASADDEKAWDAKRGGGATSEGAGLTAGIEGAVRQRRHDSRRESVAVPNNVVVGDDEAPIGPPTGTITTKQAVSKEGPIEKQAFADHEAEPGDEELEGTGEVHSQQAVARAELDEATQAALEDSGEEGSSDDARQRGAARSRGAKAPAKSDKE